MLKTSISKLTLILIVLHLLTLPALAYVDGGDNATGDTSPWDDAAYRNQQPLKIVTKDGEEIWVLGSVFGALGNGNDRRMVTNNAVASFPYLPKCSLKNWLNLTNSLLFSIDL